MIPEELAFRVKIITLFLSTECEFCTKKQLTDVFFVPND